MRLATWNVNSIRTRVGRIIDWLVHEDVDVLAMQEIKCRPDQFPIDVFEDAGYELAIHGLNQWNGVAIASRVGVSEIETEFTGMPGFLKDHDGPDLPKEARAIGATVGDVRLWSLYVPNGRSLDDPHLTYKLDWLAALTDFTHAETAAHPERPLVLSGDFNIAPFDEDNGDPAVRVGTSTHVSPQERAAFFRLLESGVTDVVRPFVPSGYTYWDYKQIKFVRDQGMRIDFILGSEAFADAVAGAEIHRDQRKGDAPSDHVPVVVDVDLDLGIDEDRPMIF